MDRTRRMLKSQSRGRVPMPSRVDDKTSDRNREKFLEKAEQLRKQQAQARKAAAPSGK